MKPDPDSLLELVYVGAVGVIYTLAYMLAGAGTIGLVFVLARLLGC